MAYSLTTSYVGESLLSGFNWFNGADPSHGYVSYQSRDSAQSMGLYSVDEDTGVVRLGVDHTNRYPLNQGRPSIRLESKQAFNHGLFIADFLHMPPSQCGLWPAFWSYGNDWPNGGEIDIIEGVNTAHNNIMSAHTANGCIQSPSLAGLYSGEERNTDCSVGNMNIGCGFDPPASDTSSYGDGFNAANGGVYAMKWDSDHISLWHFPRGSIPADIQAKRPNPDGWGLPQAIFGGPSCDVDTYFKNMNIVININFCGDYGNAVWGTADTCTDFAPTCSEYVANNPQAFTNAYWDVRYIEAYEFTNTSTTPAPIPEPTTTTTITSLSTTTVTVGGNHIPVTFSIPIVAPFSANTITSIPSPTLQPIATETPVNPAKIGDYAYLGCFDSSSNFQSFNQVADSKDMTLERCIGLCSGQTYAGVFDTKCYCADDIDADTRASATEGMCNHSCPGDPMEFCGGIIDHTKTNQNGGALNFKYAVSPTDSVVPYISRPNNSTTLAGNSTDLTNNSTSPASNSSPWADNPTPLISNSTTSSNNSTILMNSPAPLSTASTTSTPSANNSTGLTNNSTTQTGNWTFMSSARLFRLRRAVLAAPVTYALTVYGAVSEDKPEPAPAMAPGSNITSATLITTTPSANPFTSVDFVTVSPVPAQPFGEKNPTTLTTVVADCDCDEDETPVVEVIVPDCPESMPTSEIEVEQPSTSTPLPEPALPEPALPEPALPPPNDLPPPPPPPPPAESTVAFVPQPLPSNVVVVAAAPGSFDEAKRNAVLGLATLAMAVIIL